MYSLDSSGSFITGSSSVIWEQNNLGNTKTYAKCDKLLILGHFIK